VHLSPPSCCETSIHCKCHSPSPLHHDRNLQCHESWRKFFCYIIFCCLLPYRIARVCHWCRPDNEHCPPASRLPWLDIKIKFHSHCTITLSAVSECLAGRRVWLISVTWVIIVVSGSGRLMSVSDNAIILQCVKLVGSVLGTLWSYLFITLHTSEILCPRLKCSNST